MFSNAVILVLQEILEAMLLISVMLVLARHLNLQWSGVLHIAPRWVLVALGLGTAGAWLYGWMMPVVSTWFDYVGLEVVNALLQAGIIVALLLFCHVLDPRRHVQQGPGFGRLVQGCMIVVVALGIVREGAEIILYMQGILGQPESAGPVLLGALMATGIGFSSGVLLFYLLDTLPGPWSLRAALVLLALFAGNMAAQAVLLLTQADWLPATAELWNSSALIAEFSVTGQLLYALVGYEANPSLMQVAAYFLVLALVVLSPLFRDAWRPAPVTVP